MTREERGLAIGFFELRRRIFCDNHLKNCPKNSNEYIATLIEKSFYDMAIKALEQEPCEDEEYEKDLNGLKEHIFKEGNTLISKQDLLERFIEIDNEYKNNHWNLLQILANIDILIGKEPFINKSCISSGVCEHDKNKVLDKIRAEIEARLCDVVSDYTDGYRTAIQGALAIIDKYRTESEDK